MVRVLSTREEVSLFTHFFNPGTSPQGKGGQGQHPKVNEDAGKANDNIGRTWHWRAYRVKKCNEQKEIGWKQF